MKFGRIAIQVNMHRV